MTERHTYKNTQTTCHTDYLIIGGGFYGLYAARWLGRRGVKVLLIEAEKELFSRASYANQARVHHGYHYPRSLATARKTQIYFETFNHEFPAAVHDDFEKIYAISDAFSLTSPRQFEHFCQAAAIPCESVQAAQYFRTQYVAAAYRTREYSYDAKVLRQLLLHDLTSLPVTWRTGLRVVQASQVSDTFQVTLSDGSSVRSCRVLNATYASLNQINTIFGFPHVPIKYELCEVILVQACTALADIGVTVMDGPFFSIMPFGKTGLHTLTSVAFTPHKTSNQALPSFACQQHNPACNPQQLDNCLYCPAKPATSWPYMAQLARKYLHPHLSFQYKRSLFAMKAVLRSSELDDSRPTLIRHFSDTPSFVAILSGKINTVFDLDEVLLHAINS